MVIGVLALQGSIEEHISVLKKLNARVIEVASPASLDAVNAIVMPGGESTTIRKLLLKKEIFYRLKQKIHAGLPVLATCAGAILVASKSEDNSTNLSAVDIQIKRNAYGSQNSSFSATIKFMPTGEDLKCDFIRAPIIYGYGKSVEVLAKFENLPVIVRQKNIIVSTCHTETSGDTLLHSYFIKTYSS